MHDLVAVPEPPEPPELQNPTAMQSARGSPTENSRSSRTCWKLGHTASTLVAAERLTRQRSNSCCEDCATRTPPRDNDRGYVDIVAHVVASIFSIVSVANSVKISLPLRPDTTIVIILV